MYFAVIFLRLFSLISYYKILNIVPHALQLVLICSYFIHREVVMKSISHVQLFVTPWTVAHHAPPSMEFSRREYWTGLPYIEMCKCQSILLTYPSPSPFSFDKHQFIFYICGSISVFSIRSLVFQILYM